MRPIRVLVVDDAVVIRRLVSDILASDPEVEVAGTAATGAIALQKIPQVNPDILTLDVEMPDMSGIETVAEIRKSYPLLPVIMFSTLTERGATTTLDALAAGASDYVTKPANVGSMSAAIQAVRDAMIPKIKALCWRGRSGESAPRPQTRRPPISTSPGSTVSKRVDALVIGTSTGGPNALNVLLPALPADLPVPILIVQHMPPVFTGLLAQRLEGRCPFPVTEASRGETVKPGHAWIAPGDHHMTVVKRGTTVTIDLNQDPPENSCRPAVDPLFRSVADVYGEHVLGVVLTGMGYDGRRGAQAIRDAGGRLLAQDEATSVVWGMPGAVVEAGLADGVLPLDGIAHEIVRRVRAQRVTHPGAARPAEARHVAQ